MGKENFGTSVLKDRYESNREGGIPEPDADAAMDHIRANLQDPNFDAYETMRLVVYVMLTLVKRILRLRFTVEESYIRHGLCQCVNLLRAVGRSIIDTERLRKRTDVICWEGQAIEHVVNTMTGWFIEAMTQAGLQQRERETVIRNYRDLALANEPQLRRETGK